MGVIFFDEEDEKTVFDTLEFKNYCAEIEGVLKQFPDTGVSIAEIHRRLGRDRIRWTMDALERLNVEESGAAPVRYKLAKQIEMPKLDFGESIIIGDPRRRPVKPKVKADDKL